MIPYYLSLNLTKKYYLKKGWDDIGYSFIVGEDGNVYEGKSINGLKVLFLLLIFLI